MTDVNHAIDQDEDENQLIQVEVGNDSNTMSHNINEEENYPNRSYIKEGQDSSQPILDPEIKKIIAMIENSKDWKNPVMIKLQPKSEKDSILLGYKTKYGWAIQFKDEYGKTKYASVGYSMFPELKHILDRFGMSYPNTTFSDLIDIWKAKTKDREDLLETLNSRIVKISPIPTII